MKPTTTPGTVAILTGDLIGSTEASPVALAAAMALIADCARRLGPGTRFTRFRGDGWQMFLADPGDSLHACLYILARLRSEPGLPDTRIAAGIGPVHPLPGESLSEATGEAFTRSGRMLERMAKGGLLALDGVGVDALHRLSFAFAADYAARWTLDQAQAMALALAPGGQTQDQIAGTLGITRQAVGARLKSADHRILAEAAEAFRAVFGTADGKAAA